MSKEDRWQKDPTDSSKGLSARVEQTQKSNMTVLIDTVMQVKLAEMEGQKMEIVELTTGLEIKAQKQGWKAEKQKQAEEVSAHQRVLEAERAAHQRELKSKKHKSQEAEAQEKEKERLHAITVLEK